MVQWMRGFFGVLVSGRTFLNLLYLLLSIPLGILYFVVLVTGFALGFGLIILWAGLLILLGVLLAWHGMAILERQLAIWLLREEIPPMSRGPAPGGGVLDRLSAHLRNPVTWKSLGYLLAKFPLGIVSFVVAVSLLCVTVALFAAPVIYQLEDMDLGFWQIDSLGDALLAFLLACILWPLSLHVMNALALVSGRLARVMLSASA